MYFFTIFLIGLSRRWISKQSSLPDLLSLPWLLIYYCFHYCSKLSFKEQKDEGNNYQTVQSLLQFTTIAHLWGGVKSFATTDEGLGNISSILLCQNFEILSHVFFYVNCFTPEIRCTQFSLPDGSSKQKLTSSIEFLVLQFVIFQDHFTSNFFETCTFLFKLYTNIKNHIFTS